MMKNDATARLLKRNITVTLGHEGWLGKDRKGNLCVSDKKEVDGMGACSVPTWC